MTQTPHHYVLDANILFSAVLRGKTFYEQLFSTCRFYLPDFGLVELEKYRSKILQKTSLDFGVLQSFTLALFRQIVVVPRFTLSDETIARAFLLCKDADERDTMYIACAIELEIPFVTRDKRIYEHLVQQGLENVMLFHDLCDQLFPPAPSTPL
jgi:predicted nucleic acid-binding protein